MTVGPTRRYKRKHPLSLPCGPRALDAPGPEEGQKLTFGLDPYSGAAQEGQKLTFGMDPYSEAVHQGHVPIGSACARVSGSWQMLLANESEGNQ